MEKRRLAAIMFTDIVGYTRLMGVDEEKALQILDNNRGLHKDLLILYDGQKLKEIGDGMLCSFDSASKAVKCAIELIRKSNECDDLKLRIGIHVGEVVFSGNDVFGDGVNIASRIEAMAIPDSVLISENVYDEIRNKQNLKAKLIGTYNLKNDAKPRDIYAITNSRLKVPESEDLHSIVEDNPDLQKLTISAIEKQKNKTKKKRFSMSSARAGITLLFSLMAVAFGSFLFISFRNTAKVKWAREEAIIQIEQLIEREQFKQAYYLAEEAEKYIPNDPLLNRLWPRMQFHLILNTDPPGAHVFRKTLDGTTDYELVGVTQIDTIRTYNGFSDWRIVKEGYDTLEFMNGTWVIQNKTYKLFKTTALPDNMLFVPFDKWDYWPTGWISDLGDVDKPVLNDYYVDKYEVSNKEFKRFVDLGGYLNQEYWKDPFFKDGVALTWEEAMKLLEDKTGQSGPSSWEIGYFPKGQEDYPVTGISWYEAMAYAEFSGKALPTVYHWIFAASPGRGKEINPYSNFRKNGSAPRGSYKGLGVHGTYDMAGNVREWCVNRVAGKADRFILGGAWDELPYNSSNARALDPFDRSVLNGFRCIKYIEKESGSTLSDLPLIFRDYTVEKPVDDATFNLFLNDFNYEKTAFNEEILEVDFGDADFTCQKIYINSTYNDERICLYLFLPTHYTGPFQTILYYPSAWAFQLDSYEKSFVLTRYNYDFFIKSGRALAIPILSGMYGRKRLGEKLSLPNAQRKGNFTAHMLDVRRSIDYLQSRDDLSKDFGYYSTSFGSMVAPSVAAIEKRIKAAVLNVGGLPSSKRYPENDQINYLPRVTIPVLMLNGKHDHVFPLETSVKPMFKFLGTPTENKKLIIYEVGHTGPPRYEIIKESLNWFDTYLGPVEPGI